MDTSQEPSEEMSGGDYLEDPDMWADRLPQPYRLIDKTLKEVLETVWEAIERREIQKQQETAQVKVPSGSGGHVVCADVLTQSKGGLSCGKDVLIVGNGSHVHVLNCTAKEIITSLDVNSEINAVKTYWKNNANIIFVQLDKEIKILGLIATTLVEMVEISYQYKDHTADIMETTLSHTSSHMGITFSCCSSEDSHAEVKLGVYTLPVESWVSELSQITAKTNNEGGQDITYSRPVLLYIFSPPACVTPSNTANPHFIFQNVCDESGKSAVVPSGDLHSLTEQYFSNRRTMFASKRLAFVSKKSDVIDRPLCKPTCHFLYYRSTQKLGSPCQVAVWWQESAHLALYKLEDSNKCSTPSPSKIIPQASAIICSTISKDTNQLALSLKSGTVIILDTKIGMCTRVVHCVDVPDSISTLKFFDLLSSSENVLMLGIGTEHGKVLAISMRENDNTPVISLNSRIQKQQEVYRNTFTSSGYDVHSKVSCFQLCPHLPSLLTTVHANGTILLWNPAQQEAVCKFQLDESFIISSPTSFTFSSNGHYIFITGKHKDSDSICNVICFDLISTSGMDVYVSSPPTDSASTERKEQGGKEKQNNNNNMGLLDGAEAHFEEFLQLGFLEKDRNLMRWEERWKELPNMLIKQKS